MLQIKVPPLGESIVEATVSKWHKKEGDAVATGETIVELDTDKITVEVPAQKAGVIAKRMKNEGDVVKVDEVLGELDDAAAGASAREAGSPKREERAASGEGREAVTANTTPAPASAATPHSENVKSSPAARRVADERGIDIASVPGTGRGGVVSKPDVLAAGTSAPKAPAAPSAPSTSRPSAPISPPRGNGAAPGERETREKMTTRRKRIAENLLQSQQSTAHLTTFNEVDMSAVTALREKFKEKVEKEHGVKLTFMPFFVRAAVMALKQFPSINAMIDGDTIVYRNYVNMGIAVASDAGLVVPNVKDADRKGMIEVSREISEVARRARDAKLTMDDLTGGTFTITNGGVFGSLVSTPILNYPQVGILGLHKIQDRPVAINGQVVIRPMMYVALSYDHRLVEGAHAVQFLVRVKELVEDPAAMLIE
ncbi:MAG TPA: 2-oxoglutarate dehydrogenase complex dihydrolipoyllysine-residue succinyltransferase [Gemmatimonadaceae bacterium]|nr:2-oxoglutarate dehydrogenase complex dihydrolipoyllysine-residue succinyltransferase [Gemmatimonadaceae bacterium]